MSKSSPAAVIRPLDYADSPVHYAVASGDHGTLNKLLSVLPKLPDLTPILTESESLAQEHLAQQISAAIDTRDNPLRETPLHLAVRLGDGAAVRALSAAGANVTFQNAAGWNPLQESLLRRCPEIVTPLVQHQHIDAWRKWRRRLPRLVAALRRMRDFYMEISVNFESSIVPFVGKIAPSDTIKIWKRDGNLRADTSFAGCDGLKIERSNRSILFLNDLNWSNANEFGVTQGSLLLLNHDERQLYDAFENAGSPLSGSILSSLCNQTQVTRFGMDVTKAVLVGRKNWRRQEKKENVGYWKARVYDMHNVTFTIRSRKVNPAESREDPSWPTCGKSVGIVPIDSTRATPPSTAERLVAPPLTEETEYVKSIQPVIWLTEEFPLKTEELLPLLDILANQVKAVRRMRELLTTTLPPGTFPVKVAIPMFPTVRVVITFTKFVQLQPVDQNSYTQVSSSTPAQFVNTSGSSSDGEEWLLRSGSRHEQSSSGVGDERQLTDPFVIPDGYRWVF